MTIKEQLTETLEQDLSIAFDKVQNINVAVADCESIVSQISINFAEWLIIKKIKSYVAIAGVRHNGLNNNWSTQELFELFKKENNL